MIWLTYWKSIEHLHAWALLDAHQVGLRWYLTNQAKEFPHIGILHENRRAFSINLTPYSRRNQQQGVLASGVRFDLRTQHYLTTTPINSDLPREKLLTTPIAYVVPAGSWEGIYYNFKPFGLGKWRCSKSSMLFDMFGVVGSDWLTRGIGQTKSVVKKEDGKEVGEAEFISPLMQAKGKAGKSMFARMGRIAQ